MLNKKLIVNGNLEIAESEGGFTPCLVLVGPEPLDMLIAEHVGIRESGREHALTDSANHYLGHVKITIEPVFIVCPECGSTHISYDTAADKIGDFCYDCLTCGAFFKESTGKQTRWLTVAHIDGRCDFHSMTNDKDRQAWCRFLDMNVGIEFGSGGIYSRWDLDAGDYAEIYFTESNGPHAGDRVFPYSIVIDKQDQRGDEIPGDLVVMPETDKLNTELFFTVMFSLPWYECEGVLLVSEAAIQGVTKVQPADVGIDILGSTITRVDESKKHVNEDNEFCLLP